MRLARAYFYLTSLCFLFGIDHLYSQSNEPKYSQNVYGGIGLIQTPTARFSDDGNFGFGVSAEAPYNRIYAKVQFFPWMEAVVKYTEITTKKYNNQTYKDKGFDLKFNLFDETDALPGLALGFNDVGGTGIFSSEYIVATKKSNNIDLNLGLGWGRLGGVSHIDNFIGWIDSNRKVRGGYSRYGGKLGFNRFFSGENVSIFGGLEYFTPFENLSLKIEYDSSDYSRDLGKKLVYNRPDKRFDVDSRLNYAMNYRMNLSERDNLDLSLGFIRGNTLYMNAIVTSNLNFKGREKVIIGSEKIRNTNLPGGDSFKNLTENRKKFLTDRTIREMANIGVITHRIIYEEKKITAEISQSRFTDPRKAIDLASRVLANNSPSKIEKITIKNIDNGIETMQTTVSRKDLIRSVSIGPLDEDLITYNEYSESSDDQIIIDNEYLYPNFYWELKPHLNTTFQHQKRFFFWQLEALLHTEYSLRKGLYITSDIGFNISNNFDTYTYHIPDGQLYHVRQNRRLYLTKGETGIRKLSVDYLFDLTSNIKGRVSAGYLEWMYGGAGGEILYMPDDRSWGIGVDGYWVKQRDYDQKFDFKDYQTFTGFINYYQDIPFYNMRLKLSYGKFLGKDVGAHIDISRRFKNGTRVGGFAALTDCNPRCVGEGSFHKGVYFEMPMDLFYVESTTRRKTGYSWSPLTKDAGAKLNVGNLHYLMTDASDQVESLRQRQWSLSKIFSGFSTRKRSDNIVN